MYVIIGSHFVPLEVKFLLISFVIVRITLNVRETSEGKFSVIALVIARITLNVRTGGNSIVEVF
jgi:hypothetical protein